ncbi:PilZ domain-containing protein [Actinoplanes sp. HUAS TT8]|uniref:PilZ domain-containing protein n=1 Tax=Actinoplanes sp. HUAS TT8 TaxID=3447453 RepID=UPI003F51B401
MVTVSIGGGTERTCQVTRHTDGSLRLNLTVFAMIGVDVTVLWTQNGRGCSLTGTVVPVPSDGMPGVYLRVDGVTGGIQRRRSERVQAQLPVAVRLPSGELFPGRTVDLSASGAHVTIDLDEMSDDSLIRLIEDLGRDALVDVQILLPDGPAGFTCQVRAGGEEPGDVRLQFVNITAELRARVANLLTDAQAKV